MIDQPMWWGPFVLILALLMYWFTRPANILHEAFLNWSDLFLRLRLCWDFCLNLLLIYWRRRTLKAQVKEIHHCILQIAKKKQRIRNRLNEGHDLSWASCQKANQVIDIWSDQIRSLQDLSKHLEKNHQDLAHLRQDFQLLFSLRQAILKTPLLGLIDRKQSIKRLQKERYPPNQQQALEDINKSLVKKNAELRTHL